MRTTQIKQQLHDIANEFTFTAGQKKELDRRYDDYMNGVGETYTWKETVAMARQALANRKNKK